jgi:hypothetical protein
VLANIVADIVETSTSSGAAAAPQLSEEDAKMDAWYSKFSYVVKLIHWNFTERLLIRKMLLDRLVEKLATYTSSSASTSGASATLSDSKASTFDDQSLILSIVFQYLYDICKWKPRVKRLVKYSIATLSKVRGSSAFSTSRLRLLTSFFASRVRTRPAAFVRAGRRCIE